MLCAFKKVTFSVIDIFILLCFFTLPRYAFHKNLRAENNYVNGKLIEHGKLFGSRVHCTEIVGDLVKTIDEDEDYYCTNTDCFYPEKSISDFDLVIEDPIVWNKDKNLVIHTRKNIIFKEGGKITNEKSGSIILKAGMEPGEKGKYRSTIIFEDEDPDSTHIEMLGSGEVKFYYNPLPSEEREYKYHNPKGYTYSRHIKFSNQEEKFSDYMLVNDVYDLQNIVAMLHMGFALSQNIDATEAHGWFEGKGFKPIMSSDEMYGKNGRPFSGEFDGNGYTISNLYINRPDEKKVGLFGMCYGAVKNVILKDFTIIGDQMVGGLTGWSENSDFQNIKIINLNIKGKDTVGGIAGMTDKVEMSSIEISDNVKVTADKNSGILVGNAVKTNAELFFATRQERDLFLEKFQLFGIQDDTYLCFIITGDLQKQICLRSSPVEYAGMVMPVPLKDKPLDIRVLTGSVTLNTAKQQEYVLAGEKFYDEQKNSQPAINNKEPSLHEEL